MTTRLTYSFIIHFLLLLNFLLLLQASEFKPEDITSDEELVHFPLTRENLSIHSQLSQLDEVPSSLASSLQSTEWLPEKLDQPKVKLTKVDAPLPSVDSGTTSSESGSLESLSPRRPSTDNFSIALLSSPLITSLAPFLTPADESTLKKVSKRIKNSLEALPAHRLALEMPCLAALFAPTSPLNDELVSFLNQVGPKLLSDFKIDAKNLKPVTVIANNELEHSKNMDVSFDNAQSMIWFLNSNAKNLIVQLKLKPLFEFLAQNSVHFAFNLGKPYGSAVKFSPELFPTDPLEDLKVISEAQLFSLFVEVISSGSIEDFDLLAEAVENVLGSDFLIRLVYFTTTEHGYSLLHLAAMNNCADMIDFLLVKLPEVHSSKITKLAPSKDICLLDCWLFPNCVALEQKMAALGWLRRQQLTSENIKLPSRPTPLMIAVRKGHLEATNKLYYLQNRFLADPRGELCRRPLAQLAVLSKSQPMLIAVIYKILPANGLLDFALKSFSLDNMNPIQLALQLDCSETFSRLSALNREQLRWRHPQSGRFPVHIAAYYSSSNLMGLLLNEVAFPSVLVVDSHGNSPLVYALRAGRFDNAHLLWSRYKDSFGIFRLISSSVELGVVQKFFSSQELIDDFLLNAPYLMGNVSFVASLILARKVEALRWFLEQASSQVAGRILGEVDVAGNSLLHLSVLTGNLEAFQWLHGRYGLILENYYNGKGQTIFNLIDELPSDFKEQFLTILTK